MNIRYQVTTNNGLESRESDLCTFFREFRFLFSAKLLPSYEILKNFCSSEPKNWGGDERVQWVPFNLSKGDYEIAGDKLLSVLGLTRHDIPSEIDSAYKWNLWQFKVSHDVPYERFKELSDIELECQKKMNEAMDSDDADLVEAMHFELIDASEDVNEFLDSFLTPDN